jgi:glycerol-3-phosphate acyltransferase PlsY
MAYLIAIVAAYLIGSIPFGFLVGKMRGIDVRTVGSKNIGATNVYRTVGHGWGLLAFLCDFLKGLLPTLGAKAIAAHYSGDAALAYLPLAVGVTTVAGHMWTCFMKFKGGKGIATGFGMLVALTPVLVLVAFALWVVVMLVSHYVSLGSIVAAAFLMVVVWLPWHDWFPCGMLRSCTGYHDLPLCILVTVLCAFAIWKHRTNIIRLRAHAESKIY